MKLRKWTDIRGPQTPEQRERIEREVERLSVEAIRTAADAPVCIQQLLASYAYEDLVWTDPAARFTILVAVLTRGSEEARQWLDAQLPYEEQRELVREFQGAGCAEPDRKLLRELLELSEEELPVRAYLDWRSSTPRLVLPSSPKNRRVIK